MSPAANVFRVGAFIALVLLVRYTQRREGSLPTARFVGFLTAFACLRECVVWILATVDHDAPPYVPLNAMGQIGAINVVVITGWVFTILVSYALARMIQRRSFPGTNVFLTLALTTLVTTTIGYAVEITGIRIHLWRWTNPTGSTWLPFDCPSDVFDAWGTTSFMILLTYWSFRYRLFAGTRWKSVAITACALGVFWFAVFSQKWFRSEPPHQKVMVFYAVLAVVLGFYAPPNALGSSDSAL